MKRDSRDGGNQLSELLLIRPAAGFVALGMILPEYLMVIVVGAFLSAIVLAILQTINPRDEPQRAEAPLVVP